jgi:hypothetical protein
MAFALRTFARTFSARAATAPKTFTKPPVKVAVTGPAGQIGWVRPRWQTCTAARRADCVPARPVAQLPAPVPRRQRPDVRPRPARNPAVCRAAPRTQRAQGALCSTRAACRASSNRPLSPYACTHAQGVVMELDDCAFPLLKGVVQTESIEKVRCVVASASGSLRARSGLRRRRLRSAGRLQAPQQG